MDACLSDQDLEAFVRGSGAPEQIAAWDDHLKTCDSCAARWARRQKDLHESTKGAGQPDDTSTSDLFAPGTKLGDFQIEGRLGSGGMGIVYRARQIPLNRPVALKVLPPGLGLTQSAVIRFRREAQAAAKLHHTNIVAIYAEGQDDATCFYAMELIEGQGLDQVIAGLKHPNVPPVS